MAILEEARQTCVHRCPVITSDPAGGSRWIPSLLFRMTVEQYEAMVESGAFTLRATGFTSTDTWWPRRPRTLPTVADELCASALLRIVPPGWHLLWLSWLPGRDSEPELPIAASCAIRDYEDRHPGPEDIAAWSPVLDSSLPGDRAMADAVYGPSGIPVYWIVNVVDGQLEVYTDPGPQGYRSRVDFSEPSVPAVIDGRSLGQVAVADVMPSAPASPETHATGLDTAAASTGRQDPHALRLSVSLTQ